MFSWLGDCRRARTGEGRGEREREEEEASKAGGLSWAGLVYI